MSDFHVIRRLKGTCVKSAIRETISNVKLKRIEVPT